MARSQGGCRGRLETLLQGLCDQRGGGRTVVSGACLSRSGEGNRVVPRVGQRRRRGGEREDVQFLRELPGRERGLFEAFVDSELVVCGDGSLVCVNRGSEKNKSFTHKFQAELVRCKLCRSYGASRVCQDCPLHPSRICGRLRLRRPSSVHTSLLGVGLTRW